MISDKKTLGLTSYARNVMDQVMTYAIFNEELHAARFALALAINTNVKPDFVEGATTVWNVGSFDPDGEIKSLTSALYPDYEITYRHIEYLVNKGLDIIGNHIEKSKILDIVDLIDPGKI